REDLFYRLNVIPLRVPPLRERLEDLEPIARAFLNRAGYRKATFAPQTLNVLRSHLWPGNVRELCNGLERAAIVAGGDIIDPEHLLLEEEPLGRMSSVQGLAAYGQPAACSLQPLAVPTAAQPLPLNPQSDERIRAGLSVQEMEERLIQKTLNEVNDNRT